MPSISQQDYIYVEVKSLTNPTDAEMEILRNHAHSGTILDVVILHEGVTARVVGYWPEEGECYIYDPREEAIRSIYYE